FTGISEDGELASVGWNPPYHAEPIPDARWRRTTLFALSQRYPTLASLCPRRPDSAIDCRQCGGTGKVRFGIDRETVRIGNRDVCVADLEDRFVCCCGGLGWLLEGE
ncbi:MAG: hypothetical protein N2C14_09735, partial [Planctomycetales bacterium]